MSFDAFYLFMWGAAAGFGFDFEAVVFGWVVAGGDHDAGGGVHGCYGVAEGGGWQGTVGDLDGDAVVGDDFGGGVGKLFRLEAGIVANGYASVSLIDRN